MLRSRWVRRTFAAFVVLSTSVPGGAAGQSEPPVPSESPAAAEPDPSAATVTLITGDRVTVRSIDGEQSPRIEPADGRRDVAFAVHRAGGHLRVVPADAARLLATGRLDPRLFDVTALVEFGYDDAHREDIPLIVTEPDQGFGRRAAEAADAAADDDGEVTPLPAADAVGVSQPKSSTADLWADLVAEVEDEAGAEGAGDSAGRDRGGATGTVWLDGMRRPGLDVSVPQIGAPEAWAAGFTGAGVKVALLDSGVDTSHPDLAGRVTASRNFVGGEDDDLVGHGTHVASTIVGSGAASDGRYRGVAPDALLLSGKVCDFFCPESAILAGMQWATDEGARVVNLSLGDEDRPGTDPLEAAIDNLSAQTGALFVVAAGNDGPDAGTLSSPASADAALSVGAVDDHDQLADFSSHGPRIDDGALAPDVTAPGVGIVAARAANGYEGDPVDDHYTSMSGTSMATPHVTGAAALLAQQHPDWQGDQIEAALIGASRPTDAVGVFGQGAGRIDVARAVGQDVTASPAVVSADRPPFPHDDDEPSTHTVTYSNPGPSPVTLSLTTRTLGPDGQPAAAGMFTLSADQVVVPAGGKAGVDVTVDTSVPAPLGEHGAWITATSTADGDPTATPTVVTTPVAVDVEPELHELTLVTRNDNGDPTWDAFLSIMALDGPELLYPFPDESGTVRLRLPPGHYTLDAVISTWLPDDDNSHAALLVQPDLELTADTTVELDARQAQPVDVRVRRAEAVRRVQSLVYNRFGSANAMRGGLHAYERVLVSSAQLGPAVAPEAMTTELAGLWAVPDADGGFLRSTRSYQLAWFEKGRMIDGATHVVRDADLAAVRTHLRASGDGRFGHRGAVAVPSPDAPWLVQLGDWTELPIDRTELYNTDGGIQWSTQLLELRGDPNDDFAFVETPLSSPFIRYRPGRTYDDDWNRAPLGPQVDVHAGMNLWCPHVTGRPSSRLGDTLTVAIPMRADATGHPGCPLGTGTTRLLRDGTEIGVTDDIGSASFEVPTDRGTYRLEVDATRAPAVALSPQVSAAWTFTSAHVGGSTPRPLPLMAVRFRPRLDDANQAPAGQRFAVPFTIETVGGAGHRIARPTVEVSYDDGTTWTLATVESRPDGYAALLRHPASGDVSLRATVTDHAGNKVEQTILRAYHLAP
jgi:subtilisin family serine protease